MSFRISVALALSFACCASQLACSSSTTPQIPSPSPPQGQNQDLPAALVSRLATLSPANAKPAGRYNLSEADAAIPGTGSGLLRQGIHLRSFHNPEWIEVRADMPGATVYRVGGFDDVQQPTALYVIPNWEAEVYGAAYNQQTQSWDAARLDELWRFPFPAAPSNYLNEAGQICVALLAWPESASIRRAGLELSNPEQLPRPLRLEVLPRARGLDLRWQRYSDPRCKHLHLQCSPDGLQPAVQLLSADADSVSLSDLLPNAEYHISLWASDEQGNHGRTATTSIRISGGWLKTWGSGQGEQIEQLSVLPDGSLLAAGWTISGGGYSGLLLHYSGAGELRSARSWPASPLMQMAANGSGILLGGYRYSAVPGDQALRLIRLNPDGSQRWALDWTVADIRFNARAVGLDAAGNSYVAGELTGSAYPYPQYGFLLCFNPQGTLLWQKRSTQPDYVKWKGVAIGAGAVYVSGALSGAPGEQEPTDDGFVLRASLNGELEWARRFNGPQSHSVELPGLLPLSGGGVVVGGSSALPYSMFYIGSYGHATAQLLLLSADGTLLWQRQADIPDTTDSSYSAVSSFKQLSLSASGLLIACGDSNHSDSGSGRLVTFWTQEGQLLSSALFSGASGMCSAVDGQLLMLGGGGDHLQGWLDPRASQHTGELRMTELQLELGALTGTVTDHSASLQPAVAAGAENAKVRPGAGEGYSNIKPALVSAQQLPF